MEDLNKITSTRVGDNIHFFVNGAEDSGTVVKMDTSYVTVVKRDGNFQDIHINDTFFIKDILVNKSWNDMTMEERTVELHKVHAYSPRFLGKAWKELPQSLKDVMKNGSPVNPEINPIDNRDDPKVDRINQRRAGQSAIASAHSNLDELEPDSMAGNKESKEHGIPKHLEGKTPLGKSNVEQGHLGGGGRSSQVVETNTDFDAPDDYEGQTEDEKKEQFKHEDKKPETTNKTMQEQLWEEWLSKDGGMGGGSPPASTSSNNSAQTNDSGIYNPVYGDKGRHGGQGRDKEEEDEDKDDKDKQQ
jgi:hypothetical protein